MARPRKNSFSYFSLDVDYYDDPAIQELFDEFGPIVELVYIRVLCLVFSSNGYYLKMTAAQLSKVIYRSLKSPFGPKYTLVESIITHMAEYSLLDKTLLSSGVVTSHGIQIAFMNMSIRRRNQITEFSLLTEAEIVEFNARRADISAAETGVIVTETGVIATEMQQSKVKEIKEKKSKKDKLKMNLDIEFYENYFEPSKWTKVLIDNGLISDSDLKIPSYNALFKEVINSYKVTDMARAFGYLVAYLKHPSYRIDDMYAYIRHALINNTDWVSHEDERTAYFEQLSIQLEEYKRQQETEANKHHDDDDLPF